MRPWLYFGFRVQRGFGLMSWMSSNESVSLCSAAAETFYVPFVLCAQPILGSDALRWFSLKLTCL